MRQVNIMKGNDGEDMQTNKILILTGETNEKLNSLTTVTTVQTKDKRHQNERAKSETRHGEQRNKRDTDNQTNNQN